MCVVVACLVWKVQQIETSLAETLPRSRQQQESSQAYDTPRITVEHVTSHATESVPPPSSAPQLRRDNAAVHPKSREPAGTADHSAASSASSQSTANIRDKASPATNQRLDVKPTAADVTSGDQSEEEVVLPSVQNLRSLFSHSQTLTPDDSDGTGVKRVGLA